MPPTAGCQTTTNPIKSPKDFSQQNHISNSKSNMSLRQQTIACYDSNKSKSVTSLSVGVQCNPGDVSTSMDQIACASTGDIVKANSRTALIGCVGNNEDDEDNEGSVSSSGHQDHDYPEHGNCRHHQHSRKPSAHTPFKPVHQKYHLQGYGPNKNLHFSDPDFRTSLYQDDDDADDDFVPLISSQSHYNKNKQGKQPYHHYHLEESERYEGRLDVFCISSITMFYIVHFIYFLHVFAHISKRITCYDHETILVNTRYIFIKII